MDRKIFLETVSPSHLQILFSWLNSSRIRGVYDMGYSSLEAVEEKYLSPHPSIKRLIASDEIGPFGYIQWYFIDDAHPYTSYGSKTGRTVGIDLFIGEELYVGKGYGKCLLSACISSLPRDVERVIVDPNESNTSALFLFQRYGFQKLGTHLEEYSSFSILGIDVRKAVRGIILSPEKELLLIQMKSDPAKSDQRGFPYFWFTPGGKVEGDETYEEALLREIQEETGIDTVTLGPPLFSEDKTIFLNNFPCRLFNQYYLVHSPKISPTKEYLVDYEKELVLDYKWWPLEELSKTQEVIFPPHLSLLLRPFSFQGQ